MILSDSEIAKAIELGHIVIKPFKEQNLGPNSYDLTLQNKLLTYCPETGILDSKLANPTKETVITDKGFTLWPNKLYLASTVEWAGSSKFVPVLEGRSSYARLGLDIHITAGYGDISFFGNWTLELRVVQPLIIYPHQRICQIVFHTVLGAVNKPYNGKYNGSTEAVASKLHTEM